MNTVAPTSTRDDSRFVAPLLSTFGIVMFLFFIDEGYYNMKWMLDGGAWIVFLIYTVLLLPVQLGISEFIFRRATGSRKYRLMLLVAMPATILILMGLFAII